MSKRDELLNTILKNTDKKLIAVAGTHGKTTTTAMAIWLFQQLNQPVSYSVGAKMSFADMGKFDPLSDYFIYECDEFDRNFLAFQPDISVITGIDYDHHEIFPTREDYEQAFRQFMDQSTTIIAWQSDESIVGDRAELTIIADDDPQINQLRLPGHVNRRDAWQIIVLAYKTFGTSIEELISLMEKFPGLSRRFEKITDNLYSDYAHTIPKIAGCLQMALELSDNVVVIYEPLTNRRQYFIRDEYADLFAGAKRLYWVPSYLAREDAEQAVLTPAELIESMSNKEIAEPAELSETLKNSIQQHLNDGDLVVSISGGGGNSLDEWIRREFTSVD